MITAASLKAGCLYRFTSIGIANESRVHGETRSQIKLSRLIYSPCFFSSATCEYFRTAVKNVPLPAGMGTFPERTI